MKEEEKLNSGADSSTILELYKLHVEMADRVSQRRAIVNNWFLAMNSSIVGLGSYLVTKVMYDSLLIVILSLLGLGVAFIWKASISSYKKLNSAKFKVINGIEEKYLPIKPYIDEYEYYKEDKRRDFTAMEIYIPKALMIFYIVVFIAALIAVFTHPELFPKESC